MPTYNYKCVVCGATFEKVVSYQGRNAVRCPVCNGMTDQKFTPSTAFRVEGLSADRFKYQDKLKKNRVIARERYGV